MSSSEPTSEDSWCAERSADVAACLQLQGIEHGRIGEWPAWHVMPYASVWAVESPHRPEWIGWWVISGDLPSDVLAAPRPDHAARRTARFWQTLGAARRVARPR
jgi:hypothetical protein